MFAHAAVSLARQEHRRIGQAAAAAGVVVDRAPVVGWPAAYADGGRIDVVDVGAD
jgi:hypothetical protein